MLEEIDDVYNQLLHIVFVFVFDRSQYYVYMVVFILSSSQK